MKRFFLCLLVLIVIGCEKGNEDAPQASEAVPVVELDNLARLFAELPLGLEQVGEVHDAVSSSSGNGYDEEYMMRHLLEVPGKGVGSESVRSSRDFGKVYGKPLKDMLETYLEEHQTRSDTMTPGEYLELLYSSGTQIYWPYSECWDGETMPVITFDPEDGSDTNVGYVLVEDELGHHVEELIVSEETAKERPVWVMNRNDDSAYSTIELLRKDDPTWGTGGGSITIDPQRVGRMDVSNPDSSQLKTLMIKDFTAMRNYDSWFRGAAEFFCKIGSIEEFTASTETELKLFNPVITDFMIVVRRDEVGVKKELNTVLVSDMSPQLVNSAFMLIEDDGGKQTKWECDAVVKIKSKSYGFMVSIPYNSNDDIVWRGSLSTKYFWNRNNVTESFGDVKLTFSILQVF